MCLLGTDLIDLSESWSSKFFHYKILMDGAMWLPPDTSIGVVPVYSLRLCAFLPNCLFIKRSCTQQILHLHLIFFFFLNFSEEINYFDVLMIKLAIPKIISVIKQLFKSKNRIFQYFSGKLGSSKILMDPHLRTLVSLYRFF